MYREWSEIIILQNLFKIARGIHLQICWLTRCKFSGDILYKFQHITLHKNAVNVGHSCQNLYLSAHIFVQSVDWSQVEIGTPQKI